MRNYTDQDWKKCVFITNEINTFLNEIAAKVRSEFEPYLNQQVLRKDKRIIKKLVDRISSFSTDRFVVRLKQLGYPDYKIHVFLSYSESFAEYRKFVFNLGFHVGRTVGQNLAELYDVIPYQTDYQIEELKIIREDYNAKLHELREIKKQFGWGEFLY